MSKRTGKKEPSTLYAVVFAESVLTSYHIRAATAEEAEDIASARYCSLKRGGIDNLKPYLKPNQHIAGDAFECVFCEAVTQGGNA